VDARAEQRKLLELAKTAGDTMAATTHDSRQAACKIMANSFYGAMGSNMFVFFSVESSSTITWCGRQLIGSVKRLIEAPEFMVTAPEFLLIKDKLDELRVKYVAVPAAEAISEFFSEYDERANAAWNLLSPEQRQMLGGVPVAFRVTAIGCKVVYIDTDSNYVHPEGFVMRTRAEHPEMSDEERLCIAANEARRYLDVLITVVNRYISRDPIKLSYEKVMAPAYLFFTKKRYVGRKPVLDKDGDLTVAGLQVPFNPKKHLVATGMDAVRRSTIELVKESQHILFSEMLKYGGIVESPGAIIQRLLEGVMKTPELEVAKIVQMHSYKPDKMNALTRVVQEWPVSRPRPTPTERIGVVVLKSKDRIVDAHGKKLPDTNASRSVIVDDYLEMRQNKIPVELDRLHYAEVLANALAPLMMVGMGAELAALLGEPAENIERQLRTAPDEDEGEDQKKAFATIKKRVVTALLRQYTSVRRAEVKCCVAVAKKVGNSQGVELSRAPDLFDPRLVAPSIECAVTCLRTLMDDIIKKGDRRRSFVKRAHADLDVVLRGCSPDTRPFVLADLIASREEALVRMTQECVRVVARISEEVFEQSSADGLRIREPDYLRSQMNQLLIFNPKEFTLHTKYPGYERVADLIVRLAAFKLDISNLACLISAANAALSQ
jgi:hypothetical protein